MNFCCWILLFDQCGKVYFFDVYVDEKKKKLKLIKFIFFFGL